MSDDDMMVGGYQLKNCVASGSTTQIWECSEAGSPMQLAMKLMLEDARKDSSERAILKHEFKIGSSLEHPSFLRFHDIEINRDHAFFVMDYFRSPSLKTHITSNIVAIQSAFPKMAQEMARAFQYMHENGWLHRDIKPDNVLVNRAGEIRVIDFSLAARVKGKLGLMFGKQKRIQGTRTYIAPETIRKKPATEQTDMYSLGVTFFETLTGQPPFAGDTPKELLKKHLGEKVVPPSIFNPNVTRELDAVIIKMLNKNPKERYENMHEVATALSKVRCFEQDPLELHEAKVKEEKENANMSVDVRLDSRADAARTEKGLPSPNAGRNKEKKVDARIKREQDRIRAKMAKEEAAGNAPEPQPMQPQMPMQPMPGMPMPGMPMQPQMPMPGMPMQPQMPMPGMPMQPQMPMPGMPMQPQQMPGMPMPGVPVQGQPAPQQAPAMPQQDGQPVAPQAVPPQAAPPQQPPAAQPPAAQPQTGEPEEMSEDDLMNIQIE